MCKGCNDEKKIVKKFFGLVEFIFQWGKLENKQEK